MTRTVARRRGRRDASSYPIKPIMMIVSMETYLAADLSVQSGEPVSLSYPGLQADQMNIRL